MGKEPVKGVAAKTEVEALTDGENSTNVEPAMDEKTPEKADVAEKAVENAVTGQLLAHEEPITCAHEPIAHAPATHT